MPLRRPSRAALLVLGLVLALSVSLTVPRRSLAAESPSAAEIARLIEQLGSKDFDEREAAAKKLAAIGKPALEALLVAKSSSDPEIRQRAERLVDAIRAAAARASEVRRFEGHTGRVVHVAVTADGKTLLTASQDGTVRLWEIATGKEVRQIPDIKITGRNIAFSADGKLLAVASSDRVVRLIETSNGKERHLFRLPNRSMGKLDLSPDGKRLVTSATSNVTVWDTETGKEICRLEEPVASARTLAISSDSKLVVTTGNVARNRLCISDATTGKLVQRTTVTTGSITEIRFSPDGKQILAVTIVAGTTHCLVLYDAETLKEIRRFEGHTDPISTAVLSADGRYLLSVGGQVRLGAVKPDPDYSIRLWDVQTGKEIQRLEGHPSLVPALAFTPDGKHAISGGYDNTVRMWKLMK